MAKSLHTREAGCLCSMILQLLCWSIHYFLNSCAGTRQMKMDSHKQDEVRAVRQRELGPEHYAADQEPCPHHEKDGLVRCRNQQILWK